jgi:hypothetical protein
MKRALKCLALAALCLWSATAASAAEAGVSVSNPRDTASMPTDVGTVIGTPRGTPSSTQGTTTVTPPASATPDPGQPEIQVTEPPRSVTPAATTETNRIDPGPSGGRDDRKSFPWWILLIIGVGIAAAA